MNLPAGPIQTTDEIKVNASVFIRSVQYFYHLSYNVAQCGHIESIEDGVATIDWHHGVAPRQKVNVSEIKRYQP